MMQTYTPSVWHAGQDTQTDTRKRPMIDEAEVRHLANLYGIPIHRRYDVQAGGSILKHRWRKDVDRRAEVVFAIQGRCEQIWLHTKHQYEQPIYRLPSGGIELNESVVDAMLREVDEETGLTVQITRFVGLPPCPDDKEVSGFRSILPSQLPQISADLRNIIGERRYWGHWRALPHDVLHEALH